MDGPERLAIGRIWSRLRLLSLRLASSEEITCYFKLASLETQTGGEGPLFTVSPFAFSNPLNPLTARPKTKLENRLDPIHSARPRDDRQP